MEENQREPSPSTDFMPSCSNIFNYRFSNMNSLQQCATIPRAVMVNLKTFSFPKKISR